MFSSSSNDAVYGFDFGALGLVQIKEMFSKLWQKPGVSTV
jgi:hypothetical protein